MPYVIVASLFVFFVSFLEVNEIHYRISVESPRQRKLPVETMQKKMNLWAISTITSSVLLVIESLLMLIWQC